MFQLFDHQNKALTETEGFNRCAYYLDMGLGKTYVGSEKLTFFDTCATLLICQHSKIDDWVRHFIEHYPEVSVYNLTNKKQFDRFLQGMGSHCRKVGIINYELTFRRSRLLHMNDICPFTLMLDESSLIQNETTKRAKFALGLKPQNVVLLSGTPTGGKYEKLWSQCKLLGWDISKDLFYKQYVEQEWVEEDGFFRKHVVGYKNVDRLKKKLAQHGAVFMKTEDAGIDLPEMRVIPVLVKKTKQYSTFMKKRIITVDGKELVGDSALTRRLYARMLCGQYHPGKLEAFKDLVDGSDDRFVVFYNFTEELNRMMALVQDRPISIINGKIKDRTAFDEYGNSIVFVQYQAGAKGLNLQAANKMIYFTLPQSSEDFDQSHKRIHRIDQKNNCLYYYLLCAGSVEEDILDNLKMRRDYTDALFEAYERSA
jgi:SNF2 family DNA or RNA helicase